MYRYRGIKVSGEKIEPVASREGQRLLILGGSKTVWTDYFEARKLMPKPYDIMCINDIAGVFKCEPINHIVSLHAVLCEPLRILRREKGMVEHVITHSYKHRPGVQVCWDGVQEGEESGHLALKIALLMGYEKIIICGISLDNKGHFFDPKDPSMNNSTVFNVRKDDRAWEKYSHIEECAKRTKAISGRLASIFGYPKEDWLK